MFEHLGHIPETTQGKDMTQWKKYLSFLFVSVFVFIFISSIASGPETSASQLVAGDYINVEMVAISDTSDLVSQTPRASVFNFIVNSDTEGVYINNLKLHLDGVYEFSIFANLKLLYQGAQLGNISQVDDQGNVYFDLENAPLIKGQNIFNVVLSTDDEIKDGDILQFSVLSPNDISLSYKNHIFTPEGEFPINAGATSFSEKGLINAYNNFRAQRFLITEGVPNQIASFSLMNKKEMADIKSITVGYESKNDLSGKELVLLKDKNLISRAVVSDNKINFKIDSLLVLRTDKKLDLDLHSMGLPEGEYRFFLDQVEAIGHSSRQSTYLKESLKLANFDVVSEYPQFKVGDLDKNLTLGWNKIYEMEIKSIGTDQIDFNKITWALDLDKVELEDAEMVVDHKIYPVDLILNKDRVVAKFDWQKPLPVTKLGTKVALLVKVSSLEPNATILSYLINDEEPIENDDMTSNIIWSIGDDLYNSYLIPHLPLDPSVLGK
ncbi:hypothetical protein C0580_01845 [Candidatus Parcubacteria bacterium]|nr:MAG: hypothetical protein C0580_01845 [Candidatus Parcubacteria bacterium]